MGLHTHFCKSKKLYIELDNLLTKIGQYEDGEISLSKEELKTIFDEVEKIIISNKIQKYHNTFRSRKRDGGGLYIVPNELYSKEEGMEYINNPENKITFEYDDSKELLEEFWNEYPNGLIYFA